MARTLVDATKTPEWEALDRHYMDLIHRGINLRDWFSSDKNRAQKFSYRLGSFLIDLSKNLITEETVGLLCDLGRACGLEQYRDAMFSGEHINTFEDRAVLHTALRRPKHEEGTLIVDGQDVVRDVYRVLEKMYTFAEAVRSGEWKGITGRRIETVVNIGIGGSHLGPEMVYEALKASSAHDLKARFISNVDPNDFAVKTADLDPETTLFVIVSKTFSTLETLTNAREARAWLLAQLEMRGAIDGSYASQKDAVAKHFVAVSTAFDRVKEFGIDPSNTFEFWNWVGGRYSVDSSVGTVLAVVFGPTCFEEFRSGMHAVDTYFQSMPLEQNVVMLMGLLNVWYVNFFGAESHAVLPYHQCLSRFPAYLQQLTMESNGKSVRCDGTSVATKTGEIFWGEPGTNGQHAFYQLIHQGTRLIPTDFIAFANTANPCMDGDQDVHELFLANFLAQTRALAFGKTADEVRAEGTPEAIVPARIFEGNRPSTSIFGVDLSPSSLGELVALYEHITFVEGVIWGINSFDQWGVELGKVLAQQIRSVLAGDTAVASKLDSSTQNLIDFYREYRHKH